MPAWVSVLTALAQTDQRSALQALKQGFVRHAAESNLPAVIAAAVGLCAIALLLDRTYRLRKRPRRIKRVDYLSAAARVAGLNRRELELLRVVAGRAQLPQPLSMLLSPENLRRAIRAASLADQDEQTRRRLDSIAARLFGVPALAPVSRRRRERSRPPRI